MTTRQAVRDFLLGRWAVSKRLDYRIGGGRGWLRGEAKVVATEVEDVLLMEETGQLLLDNMPGTALSAFRFYVFDARKWPVHAPPQRRTDLPSIIQLPTTSDRRTDLTIRIVRS